MSDDDCSYPYDEVKEVPLEEEDGQFNVAYFTELVECEAQDPGYLEIFAKWWKEEGRTMTRPFNKSLTLL